MGIDHAQPSDDLRFPATLPVTHPNPPYAARACVHGASITAWKKKKRIENIFEEWAKLEQFDLWGGGAIIKSDKNNGGI